MKGDVWWTEIGIVALFVVWITGAVWAYRYDAGAPTGSLRAYRARATIAAATAAVTDATAESDLAALERAASVAATAAASEGVGR